MLGSCPRLSALFQWSVCLLRQVLPTACCLTFCASLITSSEHLFFCEGPGSSAVLSHIHASVFLTVTQAHLLCEFLCTQGTPLWVVRCCKLSPFMQTRLLLSGPEVILPHWQPTAWLYKQCAEFATAESCKCHHRFCHHHQSAAALAASLLSPV